MKPVRLFFYLVSLLLCFACYIGSASAQDQTQDQTFKNPVKLSLSPVQYDSNQALFALVFEIDPGWKIYWKEPGDVGFPTAVEFKLLNNSDGPKMLYPYPKRYVEDLAGVKTTSNIYENNVVFPIIAHPINKKKDVSFNSDVSYAVCKDICIPGQVNLFASIEPGYINQEMADIVDAAMRKVPLENGFFGMTIVDYSINGEQFELSFKSEKQLKNVDLFTNTNGALVLSNPKISEDESGYRVIMDIDHLDEKTFNDNQFQVVLVADGKAVEKIFHLEKRPGKSNALDENTGKYENFYLTILFAIIGGLILNIMPCVLPVLSIKLLSVIKVSGQKRSAIALSFLTTAVGIIFSFMALSAIILYLKAIGGQVGWGFHFQEPIFIILLVVILSLFASNLWGFFEIRLPHSFANYAVKSSTLEGVIGNFLTGAFATLLATPCSAPFLGTAVGFALGKGVYEILVIFFFMGVGMALPYFFFAIFPNLVTKLPKPGRWVLKVKHVMGILLALTAIWLIWVLSNQLGTMAALILFLLLFAKTIKLWLAKHHIKFLAKKNIQLPLVIILLILAFVLPIKIAEKADLAKYIVTDQLWLPFSESDIKQYVASGKIVFVDVTADWCLTCKVNKVMVIENKEVLERLKRDDIVAMRADWTRKNEEIGIYLRKYGRYGIPFNIVYGPSAPNGILLSELLTKEAVMQAIERAGAKEILPFALK